MCADTHLYVVPVLDGVVELEGGKAQLGAQLLQQ